MDLEKGDQRHVVNTAKHEIEGVRWKGGAKEY